MKKFLSILLALTMTASLLTACGSSNEAPKESGNATTGEAADAADETQASGTIAADGALVVNLAGRPDTIDPALNTSVDGGSYIIHAFSGLVGYHIGESGELELYADCAKELPEAETLDDGKVQYVFELKDGLKWSDGSDLTAADFEYSWKRAADPATAADYGYMFDVIDGYEGVINGEEGAVLNVTASEDGKSLTVVLSVDVPYFYELCAFPAYMPVKADIVEGNEAWATVADTYIGNGPYKLVEYTESELVMEKNEFYHNVDAIKTNKLVFAFNDDDTSMLTNYQNGDYLLIDQVPNEEIKSLQEKYPDEFFIEGQLGTYFVIFNVNDDAFAAFGEADKAKIRTALSLLIDRNYVVEEIGQAGQVPANGFVAMGLTEPDGAEYISKNGPARDGNGYYSVNPDDYEANCEEAIALLKEVADSTGVYTVDDEGSVSAEFPTIKYITNEGTGHEAVATYLQATFAQYGINMTIEKQEWNTFINTRKDGAYSVARHGWLGDYNDPISFLDMWITTSGNDDAQLGKGEHESYAGYTYKGEEGKTWSESYDALISEVKTAHDSEARFELMHQAEDILMSTGAICPLYYYTDIYMLSPKVDGFFSSPLGFKYFMYATVSE